MVYRKLTDDQVAEIKRRLLAGEAHSMIARDVGLQPGSITDIARGRAWAVVPFRGVDGVERYGAPQPIGRRALASMTDEQRRALIVERLLSHRYVDPETGCWEWTGGRNKLRYGVTHFGSREVGRIFVHRLAGKIFRDFTLASLVLHRCDNPPCFNPDHLYEGTNFENARDRAVRARHTFLRGEANPNAKLTLEQVQAIRRRVAAGEAKLRLSREYGISRRAISCIVQGLTWRETNG